MANVFFGDDAPHFVKQWSAYRNKRLGGHIGKASDVRRIDPETGEVIEVIKPQEAAKGATPKRRGKKKSHRKSPARKTEVSSAN